MYEHRPVEVVNRIEAFAVHCAVHGPIEASVADVEALGFHAMIILLAQEDGFITVEDITVDAPIRYRFTATDKVIGIVPDHLAQHAMAF